ncbi:MAG: AAA family ATPase [Candidatus Heimdallarchaeaceae archaeon]
MKQAVIITGTPGTGKTTLSKYLSREGYSFIEVGKLVKEEKLYDYFDEETDSYVVNDDLLNARLIELIEESSSSKPLILDGHVIELPPSYVTLCIVLRTSIGLLRQRLMDRNYTDEKIEENVEAEIMEVILTDMLNLYGPDIVSTVRSDVSTEETFQSALDILGEI